MGKIQQRYMVRVVKDFKGRPLFNPINLGVFLATSPFSAISRYLNEEAHPYKRNKVDAVLYVDEHGRTIKYSYEDKTIREGYGEPTLQEIVLFLQVKGE